MPIKHAKISTIEDGVDTDLVQPSDWNADHVGSNLTVEEVDGTPSVNGVVKIKVTNGSLTDDGSGVVSLSLMGGVPTVVQEKNAGTQVTQVVLDAAPTEGNLLFLYSDSTTGQISSVACTNVTWTQLATYTSAGASYYALWVGEVGSSASATITFTKPGTYNSVGVIEVSGQSLTPALGAVYSFGVNAQLKSLTGLTGGDFVICGVGCDNTVLNCGVSPIMCEVDGIMSGYPVAIGVAYVPSSFITIGTSYGGNGGTLIAKIT